MTGRTTVHVGVETGGTSCRIGVVPGAALQEFLVTKDAELLQKALVSMQVPTDTPEATIQRVGAGRKLTIQRVGGQTCCT